MRAARIVDAAPDWLTVTAQEPRKQRALAERAGALMAQLERDGYKRTRARRPGMLTGEQVGPVSYTSTDGLSMVELRGTIAGDYAAAFGALGDNVSRVDGQVTVLLEDADPAYPEKLRRNIHRRRRRGTVARGRPPAARVLSGDRALRAWNGYPVESDTLYIGSRSSDRHRRVYDKGIQGGMVGSWVDILGGVELRAGSLWRFECAYKQEAATAFMEALPQEGRTEAVARMVKGAVWSDFDRVGARPVWTEETPVRLVPYREETDNDRYLRWWREQVLPSAHDRAEGSRDMKESLIEEIAKQLGVDIQPVRV